MTVQFGRSLCGSDLIYFCCGKLLQLTLKDRHIRFIYPLSRNTPTDIGAVIEEINEVTKYNYVVVNDDLENAVNKVESILISEKCRVDRIEEVFLNNSEELLHENLLDNKKFINE